MNIGVHILFQMNVLGFFRYIPKSWIAKTSGSSIFNFLRKLHIVFHSGWTSCISTNSAWGFPFLHILTNICCLLIYWWWPFWEVWGDIALCFWFAFLWWLVISSIFSYVYWPSACPLWRNVYSDPLPIFYLYYFFFGVVLYKVFINLPNPYYKKIKGLLGGRRGGGGGNRGT